MTIDIEDYLKMLKNVLIVLEMLKYFKNQPRIQVRNVE